MWIIPSSCEISPLWTTILEDKYFVIQSNNNWNENSAFWNQLVGTVQAMFDFKQAPFRILLKSSSSSIRPGDNALTIAVSESKRDIEIHWKWLHEELVPKFPINNNHSDYREIVQITCKEIEGLTSQTIAGTDEGIADDKFRATARSFRQIFSLPDNERLINYYSCSTGSNILSQGWMYISEHYLSYYSYIIGVETKYLLEIKNIVEIRKERSKKNLIPDSIFVSTSDGKNVLFSGLFHRDEVYDLLQSLINNAMHKILQTTAKDPPPGSILDNSSSSALDASPIINNVNSPSQTPTLREGLEKQKRNLIIQSLFNLPEVEEVINKTTSILWTESRTEEIYHGELFLTKRFLLFTGQNIRLVLPACSVKRMEKVYHQENGKSNDDSPYGLSLTTCHHFRIFFTIGSTLGYCDQFCHQLKDVLMSNINLAKDLNKFLSTFPSEQMVLGEEKCSTISVGLGAKFGYPQEDEKRENILMEYWSGYFSDFGRNLTILRNSYFNRIVRAGLPNKLRGELWEVCCGSVLGRFFEPNLYINTLNNHAEDSSLSMEEIEKDLTRSLPEYPAFQEEVGINSLRLVLRAYAFHNPELGYCQAMNIISSIMLIYCTEEQVFWLLKYLCSYAIPGYYSTSMYGAVLDQQVFEVLVNRHLPILKSHFHSCDIQLSVATMPWFLTLFVNTISLNLALRILDWFFLDGPCVLFQLALGVLSINSERLMDITEEGELVNFFRDYFLSLDQIHEQPPSSSSSRKSRPMTNFQYWILTSYSEFAPFVTNEILEKLRKEHKLKVIKGIGDYTKKTIIREVIDLQPKLASSLSKFTISFYYDQFGRALYYYDIGAAAFSRGLGFESFVHFISSVTTWRIQDSSTVLSSSIQIQSTKIGSPKPKAILRFCKYLFDKFGQNKSERIMFDESLLLLYNLIGGELEDKIRFFFETFKKSDSSFINETDVIGITEILLAIIPVDEEEENLLGISELLKFGNKFSAINSIAFDEIITLIRSSEILEGMFTTTISKSILLEPIITSPSTTDTPSDHVKGIISGIWNQFKSPWTRNTTNGGDGTPTTISSSSLEAAAKAIGAQGTNNLVSTPAISIATNNFNEDIGLLLEDFRQSTTPIVSTKVDKD